MKKVINRKTYDIEAAEVLASYDNGNPIDSLCYVCERLYRKDDGEYFLHCRGGAGTHYANQYSNRCSTAGEAIVPMTEDRAKEWLKCNYNNKK